MPFLKFSKRIRLGWNQRTMKDIPGSNENCDIWIQSASGGESMLTNMLVEQLTRTAGIPADIKILATSGTSQGIETLKKGAGKNGATVRFFPFDAPKNMEKAFERFSPRLAVIVETELWPGFLAAAGKKNIPVLLVNGRMSEKSFRFYTKLRFFFKKYYPDTCLTISEADKNRFSQIFVHGGTKTVSNIKFDKVHPGQKSKKQNPVRSLITPETPFILLGSIRKEEEEKIFSTIRLLRENNSPMTVGFFPKHIERADEVINTLRKQGIKVYKRSAMKQPEQAQFSVIVWDIFGELAGAYSLADAAFVGGSLINWGGHNFLEPLVFGVRPIIGPYWKNFFWAGQEIIDINLVKQVKDEKELAVTILGDLANTPDKQDIIEKTKTYLATRQGGTQKTCEQIVKLLH